jgi:hypothetical protein
MKKLITLCVLVCLTFAAVAQEPTIPVDTRTVKGCAANNDKAHQAVEKIAILPDEEMLAVIYVGQSDGRVCYAAVIKCTTQSFSSEAVFDIYYIKGQIDGPVKVVASMGKERAAPPQAPYNEMMRTSSKKQF